MVQVTISPEGEVLVVSKEMLAFRSAEGVWSEKAPTGLTVEDISCWRLATGDEVIALLAEARKALNLPISHFMSSGSTPFPRTVELRVIPSV